MRKSLYEKQALFMENIKKLKCRKHTEQLFLYYTAPVLRKVKPAVLISFPPECANIWKSCKKAMCRATGLCITQINRKDKSPLFFIYDKTNLEKTIKNENSENILKKFGHPVYGELKDFLLHLKSRFKGNEFPHEIGIFLGYPPDDVKGFIENGGKNAAFCRHWKAYGDIAKAKEIWMKIDESYTMAIDVLLKMPPINVAANLLKTA